MGAARRPAPLRCEDAEARVLQAVEGDPPGPVLRPAARQLRGAVVDGVRGVEPRVRAADEPRQSRGGLQRRPADRRDSAIARGVRGRAVRAGERARATRATRSRR